MLPALDPARLVFIDETWATTKMTPLRGRCAKGERLLCKAPNGHWKTTTFLAALRHDRIDAPLVGVVEADDEKKKEGTKMKIDKEKENEKMEKESQKESDGIKAKSSR